MAEYRALSTQKQLLLLLFSLFTFVNTQISNKRLCADKECKVVISKARALAMHQADHPLQLSFKSGDVISVTSKSAGDNLHLWGGEVNGHSGYFDKNFVKEFKVMVENPEFVMDTVGDTFNSIGKPSPLRTDENHRNVIHDGGQDADVADDEKKVKTEVDDMDASYKLNQKDNEADDKKSQHPRKNDMVEDLLKMDNDVDDILKKDDAPDDLLKNDETDLFESDESEHDEKTLDHDGHDNDEEEKGKELEEEPWDIDDVDYYEQKRDRFDTAGFFTSLIDALRDLNQFLKNKLLSRDTDEAEGVGFKSKLTEDSLEPEALRETNDHISVKDKDVDKQEQSSESVHIHSVDVSDAEGDDNAHASPEVTGTISEIPTRNDYEDTEGNPEETDVVKDENIPVEEDDFDPTEIYESSPSDFEDEEKHNVKSVSSEEGNKLTEDNAASEEKIPLEDGKNLEAEDHTDDENDIRTKISEDDQETKSPSLEKLNTETDESDVSKEKLDKKETDSLEEESVSEDELKETSSLKTDESHVMEETAEDKKSHDMEETAEDEKSHDMEETAEDKGTESTEEDNVSELKLKQEPLLKTKGLKDLAETKDKIEAEGNEEDKIEDDNEIGEKSFAAKDKKDGGKTSPVNNKDVERVNSLKEKSDEHETVHSDVRPDTPSDTLSPEYGQGEDPVASEKSQLDTEQDDENLSHKKKETGRKHDLSESVDHPSDESSELSDKFLGKNTENDHGSEKPALDHVNGADKERPNGDGFVSFLQSSRAEPRESDLATETPKLNTDSTATFIKEKVSDSFSSEVGIKSSNINDNRLHATEDNGNEKMQEADDMHTIVEGGSTIVLDGEGNLVTAISPEDEDSGESDEWQSSSDDITSTLSVRSQQMNPTAVENLPKPSDTPQALHDKLGKKETNIPQQKFGKGQVINNTHSLDVQPGNDDFLVDNNVVSEAYQSSDFNSRKVLSVNQPPVTSQRQQQIPPLTLQKQSSEDKMQQEQISVVPTSVLPFTVSSEIQSEVSDILTETSSNDATAAVTKDSIPSNGQPGASDSEEQIKDKLLIQVEHSDEPGDHKPESTTQPTTDNMEIPLPPNTEESIPAPEDTSRLSEESDSASEDTSRRLSEEYGTDSVFHSRKITDEDLIQEEEKFAESSPGFFKKMFTALEVQTTDLFSKLPPSVQSALEPFGLLPNMKVVVITFLLAMLISMSLMSCFSGGSNKKQQREMLLKFDEIEKKRLIDLKEKQNLEDEVTDKEAKNAQMKQELTKLKEESKKNVSELHTIQVHNDTLKKQLATLQGQIEELKENANSKQGEVKQQSKKTKDLEKQIKKLEERERNLEQTTQKVMSDLKHKEEEVTLLTSKVTGLIDQIGHLETSKGQLLAEAEDWQEKVSDLKERLFQREEEFKQMQETIMFKENELELLKDCFLQLKSFEDNEEGENQEDASARVQEKIAAMMDVSKVNASLCALEEEKNSLANKLEIELEARRELEEQLENSRRSVETSMADKMKAERQCQEAQTKLSVLSSYFKEKEMQLQRELGEQEALKKQNQNKLVSADEIAKSVQQEVEFVRTQSESLKRELAASERDFRSQIAANEKKAHENWLAARAAERELKEARHEAGVLRQKLMDLERRQLMGPGGLIRPLPTRGMPPSGVMNGPPPPGMERSPSRGSMPPLPPLHIRDDDFLASSRGDRGPPPFPHDPRRGPLLPQGMRPPFSDARSPPPRVPPFGGPRSPPLRMPPPGMMDGRSPPPYDRRPPPHMMDRRSPPFRLPPPDMLPPPMRGGPLPPPPLHGRGVSGSPDSPRLEGRYPLPPYGRNPPPPSDRPSPKRNNQISPRQQHSHV